MAVRRSGGVGALASLAVTEAASPDAGSGPAQQRRSELGEERGARSASPPTQPLPVLPDDVEAGGHRTADPAPKPRRSVRNALEWIGVIVGAVAVALVVKTFLFQAFYIPSPSMSPTLVKNDRVLVNKLAYRFHDVRRGDVVVFERPPTEQAEQIKDLIKRVIALPGERISIRDNHVSVNGRQLDEPYVHGLSTEATVGCGAGAVQGIDSVPGLLIPKGSVFVMGDNRVNSHDGRCFGPISTDLIVGRAFMIIWPPSKLGTL